MNFNCELGLDEGEDFSKSATQICCTPDFEKVMHQDAEMKEAHEIGLKAELPKNETTAYKEFMRIYFNRTSV